MAFVPAVPCHAVLYLALASSGRFWQGRDVASAAAACLALCTLWAAAVGLPLHGLPTWVPVLGAALALGAWLGRRALAKLARRFRFVDYVHADKN